MSNLLDKQHDPAPHKPLTIEDLERMGKELQQLREEADAAVVAAHEWLDICDMINGAWYECEARNFRYAMWDGERFCYLRTKFGTSFPDTEEHYDRGAPHGTCKPMRVVGATGG